MNMMKDEHARERLDRPGWFDELVEKMDRAGISKGLVFAFVLALTLVEIGMVAVGYSGLVGLFWAGVTGACLVVVFIWFVHECFVSFQTDEAWAERLGWLIASIAVYFMTCAGFLSTQVSNSTRDYIEDAQIDADREAVRRNVGEWRTELRLKPPIDGESGDREALLAQQLAGKRWGIEAYEDCGNEGEGFTRQAKVDICTRWSDLRVRMAERDERKERRAELEQLIAGGETELAALKAAETSKREFWRTLAIVFFGQEPADEDINQTRAWILVVLSSVIIYITAYAWHQFIRRWVSRKRPAGQVPS